jgi:PTH1 family peptidyl-tRNA hydrolase
MFRKKPAPNYGEPEWIIVGLGNPGPEYRGTRHNVGFDLLDLIATRNKIKLDRGKNKALIGVGQISGVTVMLVKPMTFMNLSGQAIAPTARSAGIAPEKILVLADDKDLALARLKLPERGGSGGHNGHKSIIASLGTQDYPRLKIGIGAQEDNTIDHVLGKFKPIERAEIDDALRAGAEAVEALIGEDRNAALRILERFAGPAQPKESPVRTE